MLVSFGVDASPCTEHGYEQCELAKQKMKEKLAAELGSFRKAVTTADGAWLTRGHHNFTYQVRDYLTGALLCYQHLCGHPAHGHQRALKKNSSFTDDEIKSL